MVICLAVKRCLDPLGRAKKSRARHEGARERNLLHFRSGLLRGAAPQSSATSTWVPNQIHMPPGQALPSIYAVGGTEKMPKAAAECTEEVSNACVGSKG